MYILYIGDAFTEIAQQYYGLAVGTQGTSASTDFVSCNPSSLERLSSNHAYAQGNISQGMCDDARPFADTHDGLLLCSSTELASYLWFVSLSLGTILIILNALRSYTRRKGQPYPRVRRGCSDARGACCSYAGHEGAGSLRCQIPSEGSRSDPQGVLFAKIILSSRPFKLNSARRSGLPKGMGESA